MTPMTHPAPTGTASPFVPLPSTPHESDPGRDAFLTARAKLALWTKAGVKSTAVHVDTTHGVVTIYGKVPNAGQAALAEQTIAALLGVRRINNLLQVVKEGDAATTARADEDIRREVEVRLKADPVLAFSHVVVRSVDKGLVLLAGEARSYSDHVRAFVCADRVPGVKRTASDVRTPDDFREDERIIFLSRMAPPAGPAPGTSLGAIESDANDMRISMEVKLRLWTAPLVPSMDISVDTDEGLVTLFGLVPTAHVKVAAGAEAEKVPGVKQVHNQLQVVPSAARPLVEANDTDLARDLGLAFQGHPELSHVTVAVKNGTARLTGHVATGWGPLHALRVAWSVAGVRGVETELKIDHAS